MQLAELWQRAIPPEPWQEGDNIPWNDPAFSARMLDEHLSQAHDAASRRSATIDRQVAWIHGTLLRDQSTAILDLGCGPGLYTSRLAQLGHTCVGIDFSPAAIAYARAEAAVQLDCQYRLEDLRSAVFGSDFGLVMCIFGEINVFPCEQASALLRKAYDALAGGGLLLLEAHTFTAIQQIGERTPSWFTAESGLFGVTPHLCLVEHFWHAEAGAATTRYYVIDLQTSALSRYAQSFQAYTQPQYLELLQACGFDDVVFLPALTGALEPEQPDLLVVVARKPAGAAKAPMPASTSVTDGHLY
jgi:SAM-dependent methyltransferase